MALAKMNTNSISLLFTTHVLKSFSCKHKQYQITYCYRYIAVTCRLRNKTCQEVKKNINITEESTMGEDQTQYDEGSPGKDGKSYPPLTDAEKNAAAEEWLVQNPLLTKTRARKETRTKCWDTICMAAKRFKLIQSVLCWFLIVCS